MGLLSLVTVEPSRSASTAMDSPGVSHTFPCRRSANTVSSAEAGRFGAVVGVERGFFRPVGAVTWANDCLTASAAKR